jgi:hypothetical protein
MILMCMVFVLATCSNLFAQGSPWTSVASTGAIDEGDLGIYAFTDARVSYLPGSASLNPLDIRYNVVNTFDNNANPATPLWNTLELGSSAPAGSVVTATLYRVRPCDGFQEIICVATNNGGGTNCRTCQIAAANQLNFAQYLYYIRVTLSRNTAGVNPMASTLRLY